MAEDTRYNGEQEQPKHHTLRDMVHTGAWVGGSVLAYRNRQAIGHFLSETASHASLLGSRVMAQDTHLTNALSDAKVLLTGFSDALGDNPSLRRTLRASYDNNIQEKMRENFEASIRNNIKKRQMLNNKPGQNRTDMADTYYSQFHKRLEGGLNNFQYTATQKFRQTMIQNALRQNKTIQQHGGDKVINALMDFHNRTKGGVFADPDSHIGDFVKRLEEGVYKHKISFQDKAQRNAFEEALRKTIEPYSGSAVKLHKQFKSAIEPEAKGMETAAAYGFIKKALETTSKIGENLERRGFKTVSLNHAEQWDEALKRKHGLIIDDVNSKGDPIKTDVTKELRKFLDKHRYNEDLQKLLQQRGLSFDFNNIVLDKRLHIHQTTGEILDNRHIRDGVVNSIDAFQENFKTPFLNFNPVDLTPWQALRSGQKKEGLQLLSAGQVHGFVRNLGDQVFEEAPLKTHENNIRNPLANSNHFYTNGAVFRFTPEKGLEMVDEDLYIHPQYGGFSRMHNNMINATERDDVDERGWLKKLFDVGYQEGESRFETYKKAWNKLSDPKYGPNALRSMVYDLHTKDAEEHADLVRDVYNIMRTGIDRNAKALNRETADILAPHVNKLFDNIKVNGEAFDFGRLADDDYLKEAAITFNREFNNKSNVSLYQSYRRKFHQADLTRRDANMEVKDPAVQDLQRWTKKYVDNPVAFDAAREVAVKKKIGSPVDFMVPFLGEDEDLIPATDKLRRAFHQYALRALDNQANDFEPELLNNGIRRRSSLGYLIDAREKGFISADDVKNAKDLELLTDLNSYSNIQTAGARPFEAKNFLDDVMSISGTSAQYDERKIVFENGGVQLTGLGEDLQAGILRAQPITGRAPQARDISPSGTDFFIMRKAQAVNNAKQQLSDINFDILSRPAEDGWDVAQNIEDFTRDAGSKIYGAGKSIVTEMFAGRHRKSDNLEDVTTLTGIVYGLSERLNNQLENFGLGLSRQNMGSFQSILGNQYIRRVVLPYVAYQQANYIDGLFDDKFSDTAADAYVNTHETLAGIKDILGINKAMRPWAKVFADAGFDQVKDWVGVKQLDFLTMGAFTDFRSADEVRHYYESGEDPVRKNRYWGIGSPTPWSGSGIEYYTPNWYRRIKSDYKFTDTMYGDESEYWANNWMPTLTHPFAPIRHFLTDRYHYEKKHEVDRPAAITGGFSEIQNIPIVGPLIDNTVGRILKPRKEHKGLEKAHEEYISAINEYIQQQYSTVEDGANIYVAPSGGITVLDKYGDQGTWNGIGRPEPVSGISGTGPTHGAEAGHVNYGNGFVPTYKTGSDGEGGGLPSVAGTGSGSGGNGGGAAGYSKEVLAAENYELAQQGKGMKPPSISSMQKTANKYVPEDLEDIEQVGSVANSLVDAFYSASELGGIYGFLTKTGIGYDESWRGTTLQSSDLMTSPSRAFWDLSLGGMGGALSEIGRRYVPRDPNKNYYSPIRNTMPEWLPGIEGSIDFLHGDPYTKIKQGEMRLPGKSYETLYKLHPDGTGSGEFSNYGIFDRFRILADIDPDSDQYKIAKHEVSLLRQSGGMTDDMEKEFDEITEQVHNKQDTIRWYDKKFSHANIVKKDVTITKVIDQNTFMVDGYDSPIRLAGIKLTKKDNQDVIDWMGQYIHEGAKIKIGVAEDPAERVNNDTYGTISAVVYTNKNEDGRFWFETNKGQSLNALIANRTWKNDVQIKDDGSATATRALYSNDMVTVGKYMEMLTHDILPKIPFVGVVTDKFLQVRTPIESYKRDQVYGSDWRPWTQPYQAWIKPMVNQISSQNPLVAGAEMAAIGHLFGKTKKMSGMGRVLGFAIGAGLSSLRVFDEAAEKALPGADGVWLPKEREKEREINEYFDRIKYVKYHGLYEQAKKLAWEKEGVDVDKFFEDAAEKGRKNKGLKRFLTEKKRMLSFMKKTGYGDEEAVKAQIDDLSTGIDDIDSDRAAYQAGKYTALAIQYHKEYEGTFYGMDGSTADRTAMMRALTPKEREYVPRFLETTDAKERQEILKYVPKDVKRMLESSWGMKVEGREDIKAFFKDHFLPDQDWAGWSANVNLDDIKIKVMQKEGINPTQSGYWQKDQARAEQHGAKAVPIHSLSSNIDTNRLQEVLRGAGLSDVDVKMTRSFGKGPGGINTNVNIVQDVKGEILDNLNAGVSLF